MLSRITVESRPFGSTKSGRGVFSPGSAVPSTPDPSPGAVPSPPGADPSPVEPYPRIIPSALGGFLGGRVNLSKGAVS